MGKRVRESARVVLEGKRLGERYKAGWGYFIIIIIFIFLLLSTPPTHPSRVGKPTRGQPTLDSTLPPPGPGGLGMSRWQCPPRSSAGEPDLEWPLLLNLCPARCYVPTYFTSVKN